MQQPVHVARASFRLARKIPPLLDRLSHCQSACRACRALGARSPCHGRAGASSSTYSSDHSGKSLTSGPPPRDRPQIGLRSAQSSEAPRSLAVNESPETLVQQLDTIMNAGQPFRLGEKRVVDVDRSLHAGMMHQAPSAGAPDDPQRGIGEIDVAAPRLFRAVPLFPALTRGAIAMSPLRGYALGSGFRRRPPCVLRLRCSFISPIQAPSSARSRSSSLAMA